MTPTPISESLKKDTTSLRPKKVPPKVSLFTTADRCSLVVTGFDASKAGEWRCEMEEKEGRNRKHEQSTRLSVARRTQVSVSVPAGDVNNFNAVVGSDYRITCSAKAAFPEASVDAFFGHGSSPNVTADRRLESRGMSRYDVGTDALSFDFVYRPTPSDHGGFVKCVALQVKPADVGSYVNYFMERKNGDVADDEPDFVPPMVGESEIIFTTFEAVPVQEVFHRPLIISGPPHKLVLAEEALLIGGGTLNFSLKANPTPSSVIWKEVNSGSRTGRGVGLKMVALADNLVEISTQLPRYEDAFDKRAFVLEVSNNYGSVSHKVEVTYNVTRMGDNDSDDGVNEAIIAGVIAGVVFVMAVVVFGIYRYCKSRKPSTVPDSEAAVIRRHHSSESSSKGLIDGGQQKFRRESKRFSFLEETNGFITMRFDPEGSLKNAKNADMESGSESSSDSGSRGKVLVTELKQQSPVHEGWIPDLMKGVISAARSFESFVVEPKSLDGNEDNADGDSNLYAEIQANEEEPDQDSRLGKDYDSLDFYRPNQQHRSHYHRSHSGLNSVGSLDFEKAKKKAFREDPPLLPKTSLTGTSSEAELVKAILYERERRKKQTKKPSNSHYTRLSQIRCS